MQQLAYEYARRKANLVLVARREHRLWGIRENARLLGAKHVLVMASDVVKEEECRRFISDTINYFGHCKFLHFVLSLDISDSRFGSWLRILYRITSFLKLRFFFSSEYYTVHHLVNAASLGHNFYFEEATDSSVFPHMMVWPPTTCFLHLSYIAILIKNTNLTKIR